MTGPNDDMRAAVATRAPSGAMAPDKHSAPDASTIATSSASTSPFVNDIARAPRPLRRASARASSSMRSSSSRERSAARPNCSVSRKPRKLSSTNAFIPPSPSRSSRPPMPLAFEEAYGTATPTSR